jgi:hypothetical protein
VLLSKSVSIALKFVRVFQIYFHCSSYAVILVINFNFFAIKLLTLDVLELCQVTIHNGSNRITDYIVDKVFICMSLRL